MIPKLTLPPTIVKLPPPIGDAVNLAARLEATAGRNDYKDWPIIVSRDTMELCRWPYNFKLIDSILVKGKSEPVEIYGV